MYKRFIGVIYVLNIIFQAFFTLVFPIAIGLLVSWLFVTYVSAPTWIYVPIVIFCTLCGFYSMIKFVLSAMASFERLEKEQNAKDKDSKK